MLKLKINIGICLFIFLNVDAQEFIQIWPTGKKPNSNGRPISDSLYNERIWRVGTPGIFAFRVPPAENKGTAVLICPGGGYERLSHIYNGFQLAKWFNVAGINAFVLIYRLPHQSDLLQRELAPLQDAQRAMRLVRANARQWNLKADKIGILGTSAGGHVASTLGTHPDDVSTLNDSLDAISYRPDFMILISPVISMGTYAHPGSKKNLLGPNPKTEQIVKYSNEFHVSSFTPPTFMVHALNDSTVPVQNTLLFYNALIEKKINASLHIFPQGGHNIKFVDNPGSTGLWPQILIMWLQEKEFITTSK